MEEIGVSNGDCTLLAQQKAVFPGDTPRPRALHSVCI